jgi:hypothetical protein
VLAFAPVVVDFGHMLLTLEDEDRGVGDVAMEVAVRVRWPPDDQIEATGLGVGSENRHLILAGVILGCSSVLSLLISSSGESAVPAEVSVNRRARTLEVHT